MISRENILDHQLREATLEIERLNNIIDELEKYSEDMIKEYNEEIQMVDNNIDKFNLIGAKSSYHEISNRIKELKGGNSNENQ